VVVDDLDVLCATPGRAKAHRNWSFTRMLCCPARSPLRVSRRLPGGTRRSPSRSAISSWRSFRRATWATFTKRLTLSPRASAAVSAHLKVLITSIYHNASRA